MDYPRAAEQAIALKGATMRFNSVTVCPVRSLEVGDLIAYEFLGAVMNGTVTGVVRMVYELTDEQKRYMLDNDLKIPESEHEYVDSPGMVLVFGTFKGNDTFIKSMPDHAYLDEDLNVAVFPTRKRD